MNDTASKPYGDLEALAAKGDAATPTLRRYGMGRWSYPGAPCEGENVSLPSESIGDLRVRAALAAGAWVVAETDADGKPLAVTPADVAPAVVATPLHHGTVAVMTAGKFHADGSYANVSRADG